MNTLSILFIVILLAEYIFDRWLDSLNAKSWNPVLPENAKNIYDAERYRLSREYYLANHRFGKLSSAFSLLLILAMLIFHGFAFLDEWVSEQTQNPVWMAILFF